MYDKKYKYKKGAVMKCESILSKAPLLLGKLIGICI